MKSKLCPESANNKPRFRAFIGLDTFNNGDIALQQALRDQNGANFESVGIWVLSLKEIKSNKETLNQGAILSLQLKIENSSPYERIMIAWISMKADFFQLLEFHRWQFANQILTGSKMQSN